MVTGVTIAMSIMYISLTDYGNNLSVRAVQGTGAESRQAGMEEFSRFRFVRGLLPDGGRPVGEGGSGVWNRMAPVFRK